MTLEELREEAYRQGSMDAELGYDTVDEKRQSIEKLVRVYTDELDDTDNFFADNYVNYNKIYELVEEAYDKGFEAY